MKLLLAISLLLYGECHSQDSLVNQISIKSLEKKFPFPPNSVDSCYSSNILVKIEISGESVIKQILLSDNADTWITAGLPGLIKNGGFQSIEESVQKSNIKNTTILIPVFIYSDLSYKCSRASGKLNTGLFTFNNKIPEGNLLLANPVEIIFYMR